MEADLTNPIFNNEEKAREHLEAIRWPDGPACPHCGTIDEATLLKGKSTRPGLYKCRSCEKPFSVTVGTVYERSHIPLHKWVLATYLLCGSKKGISSHQLYRSLKFGSYSTAWFMAHRIRKAMKSRRRSVAKAKRSRPTKPISAMSPLAAAQRTAGATLRRGILQGCRPG